MEALYRVVLTGELIDGHELGPAVQALSGMLKQPPEKVQRVFNGRPTPLNRTMNFRGAREIQQRLEAIGVRSKVEALEDRAPAAFGSPASTAETSALSATITCPKCGMTQPAGHACAGCTVVFSKYRPVATPSSSSAAPEPNRSPEPADPRERMLLFIGPRAEWYAGKFERFEEGKFAFGWNWAAASLSMAWAAYRGMWLWSALLILLTLLSFFSWVLYFVVNIAFAMGADYLYFRHVQRRMASLNGQPDEAVALAGGGRPGAAALAGFATLVLMALLFPWDRLMNAPLTFGVGSQAPDVNAVLAEDPQIGGLAGPPHGKTTLAAFTATATAVYGWLDEGGDLQTLAPHDFVRESGLAQSTMTDGWGSVLLVVPASGDGFIVISAGPDGLYDSDDDIPVVFPVK